MRRPTAGLQHGPHGLKGRHAEVGDLDVVLVVQQQVFRFEITMTERWENTKGVILDVPMTYVVEFWKFLLFLS